jgi:hypothetical protein
MPNVLEGTFLKNADVKAGDIIQFVDAGKMVVSKFTNPDGSEKSQMEFTIKTSDGTSRKYSPNRVSLSALGASWGGATEKWVGKNAVASEGKTKTGQRQVLWKAMD